jgi:peptide/nickel transport system permease protein
MQPSVAVTTAGVRAEAERRALRRPLALPIGLLRRHAGIMRSDPFGLAGTTIVGFFVLVALAAPLLAPYNPYTYQYLPNGALARMQPPSASFMLGTNYYGQDVLSQLIRGSTVTLLVGLLSGLFIGFAGTAVGMLAGYFGGFVDDLLMRIVDVFMGVPTLPFAIVVMAVTGPSIEHVIFVITFLFWRTSARVVRSSVLTLRELGYMRAARVAGAGHLRMLLVHVLPNVLPLTFLYVVFGAGAAVLTEASLSFLGLGDPFVVSWGQMLYFAFTTASIRVAWWWVLPPALCLIAFMSGLYFIGRAYEEYLNPRLRRRI